MIGNTEGKQMLINIFSGRRVGQTDETMVRAVLLAFFDQFIVNISDIGDIQHLVAKVLQIAAQRVKDDHRARIADVDIVVNRRAADIDAVLALLLGDKLLFLAGHGVEDLHSLHVPSSI